jgi:hypothetical protein
MPIHDWTRVDAGLFHAFRQGWISALSNALNTGGLPPGYFALIEQVPTGRIPEFLDLDLSPGREEPTGRTTRGLTVDAVPPRTRLVRCAEEQAYVRKADQITVRHRHG